MMFTSLAQYLQSAAQARSHRRMVKICSGVGIILSLVAHAAVDPKTMSPQSEEKAAQQDSSHQDQIDAGEPDHDNSESSSGGLNVDWSIFQGVYATEKDVSEMEDLRRAVFQHETRGASYPPKKDGYVFQKELMKGAYGSANLYTKDKKKYVIKHLRKPEAALERFGVEIKGEICFCYDEESNGWNFREKYGLMGETEDSLRYKIRSDAGDDIEVLKTKVYFYEPGKRVKVTGLAVLLQEILIQKSIDSDYVMKIHDVYEDHSQYYIVMEFLEGATDLFDAIAGNSFYKSEKDAIPVFRQIVQGVKDIHEAGFGHYDLKDENVMVYRKKGELGKKGEIGVKIIDFGFSAHDKSVRLPQGTPVSSPPEQFVKNEQGKNNYNKNADIWSLGCILYTMLHKQTPFRRGARTPYVTKPFENKYTNHMGRQWGGSFITGIELSKPCRKLITQCLQFKSTERPGYDQIFEALDAAMDSNPKKNANSKAMHQARMERYQQNIKRVRIRSAFLASVEGLAPLQIKKNAMLKPIPEESASPAKLNLNDVVQIYSYSAKKWCKGIVVRIGTDQCIVTYMKPDKTVHEKSVLREGSKVIHRVKPAPKKHANVVPPTGAPALKTDHEQCQDRFLLDLVHRLIPHQEKVHAVLKKLKVQIDEIKAERTKEE